MLVLTRKAKQQIVVGDDVFITILSVESNRVRLGIEAPVETPVHRLEIHRAIRNSEDGKSVQLQENA